MKRISLVLSLGIVAMLTAQSFAQDSTWGFDERDNVTSAGTGIGGQLILNSAGVNVAVTPYTNGQNPAAVSGNSTDRFGTAAINAGGLGAGEVMRLNPVQTSGFHSTANPNGAGTAWPNYDADGNSATGRLFLYEQMNDDPSGSGDAQASAGLNINLTNGPNNTTPRNPIGGIAWAWQTGASVAAQTSIPGLVDPWNGVVNGVSNGAVPPSILGNKAVRVPVTSGPVYAATLAKQPATGLYKVGSLRVTAGTRNCLGLSNNLPADNSTYSLTLSVNNLLCTRVFQSAGDAVENMNIGYDPYVASGGFGTLDAPINGSTSGATSTSADAVIQIRLHGDFNGSGTVTSGDIAGFNNAQAASAAGTAKVSQIYFGDFNNSRSVTSGDISAFNKAQAASVTCP